MCRGSSLFQVVSCHDPVVSEAWGRVAETVKRRRTDLGLSQRLASERAGISPTTWGSLEKHCNPVDDLTRAGMCRALGWSSDSIDRILTGLEPRTYGAAEPLPTLAVLADIVHDLRSAVDGLVARLDRLDPPPD